MSRIRVNDSFEVEGSFSFEVSVDETVQPPRFSITGVFTTGDRYMEELKTLQNERYRLEGVKVHTETFGSEEDAVVYHFTAGAYGKRG